MIIESMIFAGSMTVIGIGAGLVVAHIVISKKDSYYKEQISKLNEEALDIMDDLEEKDKLYQLTLQHLCNSESKLKRETNRADYFEQQAKAACQKLVQMKNSGQCNVHTEDKDLIVKALKKAMVSAHPDRNGGKDDGSFQKYNDLYKKYK